MKQLLLKKSGIDYSEFTSGKKFNPFLKFEDNVPKNIKILEYLGKKNHFFGYDSDKQVLMDEFLVYDIAQQIEKNFSTGSKRFMRELEKHEPILNKEIWILRTGKKYDTQYKITTEYETVAFLSMSLQDKVKITAKTAEKSIDEIRELMDIQIDDLSGLIDEDGAITLVRKNLGL